MKREKEEGRKDDLRRAILAALPAQREQAPTRDEIWAKLPDATPRIATGKKADSA